MRKSDIFIMGLKNLFRRKTRTLLTVLGVVIGTAAIVVMVSLGLGMNESYDQQIKQMGSLNIINVTRYRNSAEGRGRSMSQEEIVLDDAAITKIKSLKGVAGVTPVVETYGKLIAGKKVSFCSIIGIDSGEMANFDYRIAEGRLLKEGDADSIVVGGNLPMNFYNPKLTYSTQVTPVKVMTEKLQLTFDMEYGERRRQGLGGEDSSKKPSIVYKLKAVGLLVPTNTYDNTDYAIFMDIKYLKKLIKDTSKQIKSQQNSFYSVSPSEADAKGYERLMVKVEDIDDVDSIQEKIDEMGYGTNSLSDIRKSMQKQSQTLRMVLGGLGAISLLISALGITNTMIMSIYERTREIGVMKVLGCKLKNIKQLFLFEAGVIGLFGGILGIILSYVASFILNKVGLNVLGGNNDDAYMGMGMVVSMGIEQQGSRISVIPPWLALFAVAFAILIGLISGYSPARRAMKLSALEAIKTE